MQGKVGNEPWGVGDYSEYLCWYRCIMAVLEADAQPHNSRPYIHIGFKTML